MDISLTIFWRVGAATGDDSDSMNTGTINDYMIVRPFEFWKAVAEDCIPARLIEVTRVWADPSVEYTLTGTRQAPVAKVDYNICLTEPSGLKKAASPMLNSVVW
jgi:hypothetical protein